MDIDTNETRDEAVRLRDHLRAARSRVYVMTVQEASDLEYECRRIGLLSFRHDGGNLLSAVEDHFDECATRLDVAISAYDRAMADQAREAAEDAAEVAA